MASAFGVDHGISKATYTAKEKKRVRQATATGATIGGLYGAATMGPVAQAGGWVAGAKATKMQQAQNNPVDDSKYKDNPHYQKYRKAQNLADRASTPGEKQAAQGMADKIKAKHGFEAPKAAKPLGTKFKALRMVQRATGTKGRAAVVAGAALGTYGAAVGNAGSRSNIKHEKKKRLTVGA